jgi:zona occludens toxin (predicted ATPase)
MSGIISGFQKFFTKERIIIFVVLGVLLFFLSWYSGNKYSFADGMDTGESNDHDTKEGHGVTSAALVQKPVASAAVQPVAQGG